MKRGLVLLAHGARDARWSQPFEEVLRRVAERAPGVPVRLAYLEFMSPDLAGAAEALVHDGCDAVAVQPMFLGTGGHVRKDLPLLLDGLHERWPAVAFTLRTAIGEVDSVMQAMADAAAAAIDEDPAA
jgi:sirohydrochlorin cobaltochelatase